MKVALVVGCLFLLAGCTKTQPPDTPGQPLGPVTAMAGQDVGIVVVATDPAGSDVACRCDWGDADTSDWSGFLQSGVPCTLTHAWAMSGEYLIRAQAKNADELVSGWSVPETLRVDSICR